MKQIKVITNFQPKVTEYELYDDYMEFHKSIVNKKDFTFMYDPKEIWHMIKIDGNDYMIKQYDYSKLLTIEAYRKMIEECKKFYTIHEGDLVRHQKNSNTRFTGEQESIEDVIKYMRDENRSWLPQVFEEIDEEIDIITREYQKKLDKLNEQKSTLLSDEYLKSKIVMQIKVSSEAQNV